MNSILRVQQRNLEELSEIMKDDPMRIVSNWKERYGNVSIRYFYEKSYVFNEVKVLAKIVLTSTVYTPHKELFFASVTGNKKDIRSLSQRARREAAIDLVHCSRLLVADKAFQTYITTNEFLFPPKLKRKCVDIPHKRRTRSRVCSDENEEVLNERDLCEMFEEMHVDDGTTKGSQTKGEGRKSKLETK